MAKLSVRDLDLKNKRLFIRVDFNVPLAPGGREITSDKRIKASLPTIKYALEQGAGLVLASHLGRPKGKPEAKYSLAPVARRLSELLQKEVRLAPDCIGPEVEKMSAAMKPGDLFLLENLRFHIEEEKNDPAFAQRLAGIAEIYINDAFAVSHRAHASVEAITGYFKETAAGFLMKEELHYLNQVLENPSRPLAAVLGGAKVSGKIEVIKNLTLRADKVLMGGEMGYTFIKSKGVDVGKSLVSPVEDGVYDIAREILENAGKRGVKIFLPIDCIVADKFEASAQKKVVDIQEIPKDWIGMDIGPATIDLFGEALRDAKTILWNGPMGVFEMEPFSRGTMEMARRIVNSGAVSVVGGGDTDLAVQKSGEAKRFSYISTAGGAFLELMKRKKLPGVEALKTKKAIRSQPIKNHC